MALPVLRASRFYSTLAALGGLAVSLNGCASIARANDPPPQAQTPAAPPSPAIADAQALGAAFATVAERVSPSVVSLRVTVARDRRPSFFRYGFGHGGPQGFDGEMLQRGMGSGVIFDAQGHILTNNHVVSQAREIEVRLQDGREIPARVVGSDPEADLAILKIDASDLVPARLGSSQNVRVGHFVIAIGSPFGLEYTVTTGVLSAKGRDGIGMNRIEDYLQTDASINPGNSGGPLVNLNGEVIGINTMIVGQGTGIGFAIPIELARDSARQIIASGRVSRAWIGVGIQDITAALASRLGVATNSGALVSEVAPGAPGARAGLQPGDIILSVGPTAVRSAQDVSRAVRTQAPSTPIELRVRRDGREMTLRAQTAERPIDAFTRNAQPADAPNNGPIGMKLESAPTGEVIVSAVRPGSPADRAGVERGDVIQEIDRQPVQNAEQAVEHLRAHPQALLRILRDGHSTFIALE